MGWDEPSYVASGRLLVDGLTGSSTGESTVLEGNNEHPPLVKWLAGFSLRWLNDPRLLPIAFFALGCAALFAALAGRGEPEAGLFAAAVLLSTPRVFYHAHLATLDAPLAGAWALALLAYLRYDSAPSLSRAVAVALALGVAFTIKISALALILVLLLHEAMNRRWILFVAIPAGVAAFLFLIWPGLWSDPLHALRIITERTHHDARTIFYLGRSWPAGAPWHYPWVMLAVTTPVLVIAWVAAGMRHRDRRLRGLLLLLAAGAMLIPAITARARYGGVRQFLAVWVPLAGLAGLGLAAWIRSHPARATAARALAVVTIAWSAFHCAALHPLQVSYYSEIVGGPAGAEKAGFELLYWGEAPALAADAVNHMATPGQRIAIPGTVSISVSDSNVPLAAALLRRDLVTTRAHDAEADWVVLANQPSLWTEKERALWEREEPAWEFERAGVALVRLFRRPSSSTASPRDTSAPPPR